LTCINKQIKAIDTYALMIADTVQITDTSVDILTKHNKALTEISYMINENEDSDEDGADTAPDGDAALARKIASERENINPGARTSRRLASTYDSMAEAVAGAAERERRQIDLMNRRNMDRVRELARASNKNSGYGDEADKAEDLEAYKNTKVYPDSALPNQIKVDMNNKAVLLPIGGSPVPFHISTIKTAVLTTPDSGMDAATLLRINFYTANMSLGKDASINITKLIQRYAPYATFIRELTFRSLNGHNLTNAYRMIMEMRKRFKMKEIQEQEEATLVKQDKLIRTKNERVPRLSDLTIRPVVSGRKNQGNLEAHSNGLRFLSSKGEVVEIIYSNIKHAIYQPCESEIMVLIHFHLKNPIMIGKKKQRNLQVFTEVIDASQAVDGGRRNMYDPEEMDDEQRERQLRIKLNNAFKDFCRKVENIARKNGFVLEFDIPYRDLGFMGNPNKEMVFIMPTLNCLVNLTETPFFVVDLNDVDHVHFERVTFASKAFDIVLVNKDFSKPVWKIDMVPNSDKDAIQDWLTDMEISYTEGPMNLNWKSIMSTVAQDERFYMDTEEDEVTEKEAGWSFLRLYGQGDSDDDHDSAEDDSDFGEGGDESQEESEESEEEFDEESEDESDFDADEDLEEQGMDWEDMERQAIMDDKRKRPSGDGDDGVDSGRGKRKRAPPAKQSGRRNSSSQRIPQRRRR
jgi:nucleosome binding factor SPN SPT16 subunit